MQGSNLKHVKQARIISMLPTGPSTGFLKEQLTEEPRTAVNILKTMITFFHQRFLRLLPKSRIKCIIKNTLLSVYGHFTIRKPCFDVSCFCHAKPRLAGFTLFSITRRGTFFDSVFLEKILISSTWTQNPISLYFSFIVVFKN